MNANLTVSSVFNSRREPWLINGQCIRAMTYTFFNRKFANGVNEVLRWFGINLMASFQDITQNMFCNLAKISHPADLEIYYFNLELAIELY